MSAVWTWLDQNPAAVLYAALVLGIAIGGLDWAHRETARARREAAHERERGL